MSNSNTVTTHYFRLYVHVIVVCVCICNDAALDYVGPIVWARHKAL